MREPTTKQQQQQATTTTRGCGYHISHQKISVSNFHYNFITHTAISYERNFPIASGRRTTASYPLSSAVSHRRLGHLEHDELPLASPLEIHEPAHPRRQIPQFAFAPKLIKRTPGSNPGLAKQRAQGLHRVVVAPRPESSPVAPFHSFIHSHDWEAA